MQINKPEIVVINCSDSMVNSPVRTAVYKYFSWEKKTFYKTRDGMKVKSAKDSVFTVNRKIPGTFFVPTGLVPALLTKCRENGVEVKLNDKNNATGFFVDIEPVGVNEIEGITLRKAQEEISNDIKGKGRGVIHAATGVGKSICAVCIFHMHRKLKPDCKILFLAHTIDLVVQAADQFKNNFNVGVWQGARRTDGDIICSTIQTAKKVGMDKIRGMFDVVVCDEAHHYADMTKSYYEFLQNSFIPYRYGLTATLPNTKESSLALEACIGPVMAQYTINEGVEDGVLSRPKIFMIPYKQTNLYKGSSYRTVYQSCIVENRTRNNVIAKLTEKLSSKGESVLIFVREIPHGNNISKCLEELGIEHVWIHGAHSSDDRKAVKKVLKNKECLVGICSTIWNEGVSINSLNNCVNAAGMKDSKTIVQIVGRGTRVDDGKTTVKVWDFLDRAYHLVDHCMERIEVYHNNGWKVSIPTKKR